MKNKHTNRLINETSPYLLQHAFNPVDWYPWGREAFDLAEKLNKPVFLSIGYSSCHWCHVMEHETFENEAIAQVMNKNFINIKVDREERPDIDQIYMEYVQLTTGSGGWPLSVFLTPDQKPFYGGTYFPPYDKYGRPGFERVLLSLADYFYNQKDKLQQNIEQLEKLYISNIDNVSAADELPSREEWFSAIDTLSTYYEPVYGGIGQAPKFLAVNIFNLFLRAYKISGNSHYLNMVTHTLKKMAYGGIYDQLAGGFARYAVDDKWLVPHFEKMLYDNAQLIQLYLDTYLSTGENFFLQIAEECLHFVEREMTCEDGGFYSSLDADSEGEEGKFYVWDKEEIDRVLGEDAQIFNKIYDVSKAGNFEGKTIFNVVYSFKEAANFFNRDQKEIENIIQQAKTKLLKAREKRIRPALDDKKISSWNGLMLSAIAKAYKVTRKDKYKNLIISSFAFFQKNLIEQGKLKRSFKNKKVGNDGFIEDYAFIIQAFLDCYEALFDTQFIIAAKELCTYAHEHFWDEGSDGYFTVSSLQEKLIKRMKDITDSSIPSATGVMLINNLRLFYFSEDEAYFNRAEKILKRYKDAFISNPYGYGTYLAGLDLYLEKPKEIVIFKKEGHEVEDYLKHIFGIYFPNKIVMVIDENNPDAIFPVSLIKDKKTVDSRVTIYICHNFRCSLPISTPQKLKENLNT
jgi:hypothetical protein